MTAPAPVPPAGETPPEPPPPGAGPGERAALAAGALALVFALGWRESVRASLWTDEIYTVLTVRKPAGEMIRLLAGYEPYAWDHPPLYFLLLKPWIAAFGYSPLALRLPSMLAGAAALAILAGRLRASGAGGIAALALTAMAFHPALRFQMANARMYAPALALMAASIALTIRILQGPAPRRTVAAAMLGMLLAALAYTSYFGLFFIGGTGAAGLAAAMARSAERRPGGRLVLAACAAAGLLLAPWMPTLLRMTNAEDAAAALPLPRWKQAAAVIREAAGGWAALPVLAFGWLGLALRDRPGFRHWGGLLLALGLLPLAALTWSAPPGRVIEIRYVIQLPALLLAGAAAGLAAWERSGGRGAARFAPFALPLLVPLYEAKARTTFLRERPDWRVAAASLESAVRPGEFIMTGGYLTHEELQYHMREPEKFRFVPRVTAMDPFYITARTSTVIWYVNAAPLPEGFDAIIRRYFPHRIEIPGNRGLEMGRIQICAKRPFRLSTGEAAVFTEPPVLEFERPRPPGG